MKLDKSKIDLKAFADEMIDGLLVEGFGSVNKKEIDLLVLKLLQRHHADWKSDKPTAFELAKALRVKRGRMRSMLDELAYRRANEAEALTDLKTILSNAEVVGTADNQVKFQVEDGFVRECAKQIIRDDYGLVDASFDRSIVTLSADKFLFLVAEIVDDKKKNQLTNRLAKSSSDLPNDDNLIRVFVKNFVASAGKEAGQKAIKIGFALLDGGLTEITDTVKSFFSSDDEEGDTE